MNLYISDTKGKANNTAFPQKKTIMNCESFIEAVQYDNVPCTFKDNHRSESNFICSNCVPFDCDNDHSDNPEDWKTVDDIASVFPDVCFYVAFSRNHMLSKNGKPPRPKFHVYFPIKNTSDVEYYKQLKQRVSKEFPYFDANAMDAARFLFGTDNGGLYHDGTVLLDAYMDSSYTSKEKEPGVSQQTKDDDVLIELMDKHLSGEYTLPDRIECGSRNKELHSFACSMAAKGMTEEEILIAVNTVNSRCEKPLSKKELMTIVRSAVNYIGNDISKRKYSDIDISAPKSFAPKQACEFEDEKTSFIWYPYIPIGDYTVLIAAGGTGKSIFCCGLAADLSNGKVLPCDELSVGGEPKKVLIISAEDSGPKFKERLMASNANMDMIYILDRDDSFGLNISSYPEALKQIICQYNPALVILDPWQAFIDSSIDVNKVNAVRPIFKKLAGICKENNCGMILISHVNKKAQGENINNAAIGSSDLINASRSALTLIFGEVSERDTRIVVHSKSNYAPAGDSIKFIIKENSGVEWNGTSPINRQTLEEAAKKNKNVNEMVSAQSNDKKASDKLFDNIINISCKLPAGEVKNISYDEMRAEYGPMVFGDSQPKKILDGLAGRLRDACINLETGKVVKYNGKTLNGFSIQSTI